MGADFHRARGRRFAAILVVSLCALQALPGAAIADSFAPRQLPSAAPLAASPAVLYPPDGPAMNTARAIAERYWHGEPCHGDVAISWAAMGTSVNAMAIWSNGAGAYADPARNSNCSVRFSSDQAFDWPSLCTVLVHEFGHLTGHQHAADPNDVMYPVYSVPLAQCASTPAPPMGSGLARLQRATGRAAGAARRRHRHHRRHHHRRGHAHHARRR